ncbi:MAG: bifunctional DNA-formamidopyrimidine glycosylase/DNA-(apurinic or apyrimidinic site) lyase [Desulfovermiculus sp.]|nr:bifunctional DNA-formamidopyrimidine glycosylase/DNA-(apurinic or apyrimidinic site) lyase [Desulfovermiculus sp.]
MPELPEVETIARGLWPLVQDRSIDRVELIFSGCVQGDVQAFTGRLPGQKIQAVHRRGKLLLFALSSGEFLVGHLKMTGKFLFFPPQRIEFNAHTRCIVHFDNGSTLTFQDQRKFGYLRLLNRDELMAWPFFAQLGPEPLEMPKGDFVSRLHSRRSAIKALLLDQTCIAGIGNIYADESLHLAQIHPQTPGDKIPLEKLRSLHHCLQRVLTQALQAGGSSFRDYVDGLGRPGSYQDTFLVYGRQGQACRHCASDLEKIRVAGRSTVFCPNCQPQILPCADLSQGST